MKLTDKSGGFWTDLIVRRKDANLVLAQRVLPNGQLMKAVAKEAISSIKGSAKHKIITKSTPDGPTFTLAPNGKYSYGIMQRISPDGLRYEPLEESTLRHRKYKAGEGIIPENRGWQYSLRETDQHIMNGLKIKSIKVGKKNVYAEIGWDGDDERIANIQDQGGVVTSAFFKNTKSSKIPARPFRGFQQEFIDNFFDILKQLPNWVFR